MFAFFFLHFLLLSFFLTFFSFVNLFICLFVCLFIYLFICSFVHLFICSFVYLSIIYFISDPRQSRRTYPSIRHTRQMRVLRWRYGVKSIKMWHRRDGKGPRKARRSVSERYRCITLVSLLLTSIESLNSDVYMCVLLQLEFTEEVFGHEYSIRLLHRYTHDWQLIT